MFDRTQRVDLQTRRGTVAKRHGETPLMIQNKIHTSLPDQGKGWEIQTHDSGNQVTYIATKKP